MSRRNELALRDYLEHIQQAIGRIQRYLYDIDHAGFLANEEKQDAVIRNLEIIGEAAANIQRHFPDFAAQHPDFPLKAAYGTRNALAHGYFKVDLDVVWKPDAGFGEVMMRKSISFARPEPEEKAINYGADLSTLVRLIEDGDI